MRLSTQLRSLCTIALHVLALFLRGRRTYPHMLTTTYRGSGYYQRAVSSLRTTRHFPGSFRVPCLHFVVSLDVHSSVQAVQSSIATQQRSTLQLIRTCLTTKLRSRSIHSIIQRKHFHYAWVSTETLLSDGVTQLGFFFRTGSCRAPMSASFVDFGGVFSALSLFGFDDVIIADLLPCIVCWLRPFLGASSVMHRRYSPN